MVVLLKRSFYRRLVQVSRLQEVWVRPLILLSLERPSEFRSPSGFLFCVTGLKMDFAGCLGSLCLEVTSWVGGRRAETWWVECRQQGELSRFPCEMSVLRIPAWRAQHMGQQKGQPLGSEAQTRIS